MNIIITGANGFLGGKITRRITADTDFDVIAVASSKEKVLEMCDREGVDKSRIHPILNSEFLDSETVLKDVYGAIHLAFARRVRPAAEIASSLRFAAGVFHKLADSHIDRIINMSSQGVYGSIESFRTEEVDPAPENHYTMAKYAAEVLFEDILKECPHHTNLRLDLVAQSQNVIKGLCKRAVNGKITLKGGKQVFSFIDALEVPDAVLSMLQAEGEWEQVYNVGWNRRRYTLTELAKLAADAAEKCGYKRPTIELQEADISLWTGMDSSKFSAKTGWEPKIMLADSIVDIIENLRE